MLRFHGASLDRKAQCNISFKTSTSAWRTSTGFSKCQRPRACGIVGNTATGCGGAIGLGGQETRKQPRVANLPDAAVQEIPQPVPLGPFFFFWTRKGSVFLDLQRITQSGGATTLPPREALTTKRSIGSQQGGQNNCKDIFLLLLWMCVESESLIMKQPSSREWNRNFPGLLLVPYPALLLQPSTGCINQGGGACSSDH